MDDAIDLLLNPPDRGQPVYIDDLVDAVEIGVNGSGYRAWFKPKPGEQVVIERWFEGRWMGTNLYTVRQVNVKTGDIVLKDEVGQQAAMANYVTGVLKHGWRFKLPVPGLRLDKREAPKAEATLKVERPANADGTKAKGRPKGSKNRSPEEISAALHEKMLEKQAKRDAREARKKK
jgi:hypothetical protein